MVNFLLFEGKLNEGLLSLLLFLSEAFGFEGELKEALLNFNFSFVLSKTLVLDDLTLIEAAFGLEASLLLATLFHSNFLDKPSS